MFEPLAESIRSHAPISGFCFQSNQHVINLFAGDVILNMTNPAVSLPHTHQILTQFSPISYYKINFSKYLILDLGLNAAAKQVLQHKFSFKWSLQGIPYLGITLTANASALAVANHCPLIAKIKNQLKQFSQHELSWG